MRTPSPANILLLASAVAGFIFSAVSTYDFAQHLDRQVHGIHCSFIPGLSEADISGATGCHVTLMSPYSSILREMVWGGIPIALPSMAIFAFLAWKALELWLQKRTSERSDLLFVLLTSLVPVLASLVMGTIAWTQLGAACKLCIGIYASSGAALLGAGLLFRGAGPTEVDDPYAAERSTPRSPTQVFGPGIAQGLAFQVAPFLAWLAFVPDHSSFVGACGTLEHVEDPMGIMIPLEGGKSGGVPTLEVFDPLCPACQGFEARLDASDLEERLDRKAILFPLDSTCNWMVNRPIHPGACTVSEAILCAGTEAQAVIDWALAEQETIRSSTEADPEAARRLVLARFPQLENCIGKPAVQAKINHSLRWITKNRLPILTPQLYVNQVRMCDEDTDLGMDYALSRMLDQQSATGAAGASR
jgi:hypothetical protein